MRLTAQIDLFVAEKFAYGDFQSPATERGYRMTLGKLAETVSNRDARTISVAEIKECLRNWTGATRATNHSQLASFFDWCRYEGIRKDNPLDQVRRPRVRKSVPYRPTREEAVALRLAARPGREQRVIDLGLLAGLRAKELLGMQGRHFRRPGAVWVSADVAKGSREGWVPVLAELEATWREIALSVEDDEYVVAHRDQRFVHGVSSESLDPSRPASYDALLLLVKRVGRRAGIAREITPHALRHAFGSHIARYAGMREAKFMLRHQDIGTTQAYTDEPTLDEVSRVVHGLSYGLPPAEPRPEPLRGPVARLGGESGTSGARAVSALSGLLERLWGNEGIRAAARSMA